MANLVITKRGGCFFQGMHLAHIIHAHIALHKIPVRRYSPDIGSEMIRPGNQGATRRLKNGRADWSNAWHDAEDPNLGNGDRQEFGATHSSSQLPITNMTPAGPPPPAGVIVFARALQDADPARFSQTFSHSARASRNACGQRMGAIPTGRYHPAKAGSIQASSIGRRTPPPSGPPTGLAAPPPPRLPVDISNARRLPSPGGRCSFAPHPNTSA